MSKEMFKDNLVYFIENVIKIKTIQEKLLSIHFMDPLIEFNIYQVLERKFCQEPWLALDFKRFQGEYIL